MKRIISVALVVILVLSMGVPAVAADAEATKRADALNAAGLFNGTGTDADGNPIYELDRTATRAEGITMLVRMLGKETEAMDQTWSTPFTDVPDWAKSYVGYAYANGLTDGTSATTFSPGDTISAVQYLSFVLVAMGYEKGTDFQWNNSYVLAQEIGIINAGEYEDGGAFYRSDMVITSYNALVEMGSIEDTVNAGSDVDFDPGPSWAINIAGNFDIISDMVWQSVEVVEHSTGYTGYNLADILDFSGNSSSSASVGFTQEGVENTEVEPTYDTYIVFMKDGEFLGGPYLLTINGLSEYPIDSIEVPSGSNTGNSYETLLSIDFSESSDYEGINLQTDSPNAKVSDSVQDGIFYMNEAFCLSPTLKANNFYHMRIKPGDVSEDVGAEGGTLLLLSFGAQLDGQYNEAKYDIKFDNKCLFAGELRNDYGYYNQNASGSAMLVEDYWVDVIVWLDSEGKTLRYFVFDTEDSSRVAYGGVSVFDSWVSCEYAIYVDLFPDYWTEQVGIDLPTSQIDFIKLGEGSVMKYLEENVAGYTDNKAEIDEFLQTEIEFVGEDGFTQHGY